MLPTQEELFESAIESAKIRIESLEAENARLREALKPFADAAESCRGKEGGDGKAIENYAKLYVEGWHQRPGSGEIYLIRIGLSVGDLRRALNELAPDRRQTL